MSSLHSPMSSTYERRNSRGSARSESFRSAISTPPHSDGHDAVPLPEQAQLAHQESSASASSVKGPALSPIPLTKNSTRSLRSLKHSSLPIATARAPPVPQRAVLAADEAPTSASAVSHQLSPIVEQVQLSPEARLLALPKRVAEREKDRQIAAVSVSGAPESSDAPRISPVFSNFITRPLNRSISQMSVASSRTHKSVVSHVSHVPSIPPLDFGEHFSGPLVSLPSPAMQRGSAAYTNRTTSTFPCARSAQFGTYGEASSLHAESYISAQGTSPSSHAPPRRPRLNRVDAYMRTEQESVESQSAACSYAGRRWTQSLSFGSDLFLFAKARWRNTDGAIFGISPACLLFWVGFVAPWCWMIGGWMLAKNGKTREDDHRRKTWMPSLPFWKAKGAETEKGVHEEEGYGVGRGYPFVAPAVESYTSKTFMMNPPVVSPVLVDPWVFRCRVAAVTAGVIILIAFVVALIVYGVRH